MILIIDNKDSFVWNLAEYASIYDKIKVVPNTITLEEIKKINPNGIIISPGPGAPNNKRDVENCPEIIKNVDVPILGVCLGHQIIAHVFGGKVGRIPPVHGKSSLIRHDGKTIFKGIKNPLKVGRYHSLAVLEVPKDFEVSAVTIDTNEEIIMGIRHKTKPIEGVQFHPESVLTEWENEDLQSKGFCSSSLLRSSEGLKIIKNFVDIALNYK
ncbi:aminodeoxychorismate/anthranilate synthase component II [Methanothermococcus okinawensis]|uniref:anthranilate synthase n=1 Tax=Methanothermococcus okinawensis (strain DSM 14208 / JCM 11175 / IH1) TaxID=647113 RepID=F8ANJ6_METOI|nr:aminodeoxychorismate/anthranilate synthase component II [Methanothermococcus okinawensis]AEH07050.1 glutamine amidotransferase of anthranilate synthase [Methanothermococcus okinawensis IH1]